MITWENRLSDLAEHLVRQLRAEFPAWDIHREDSGSYVAGHPVLGLMHADSASELRERLRASGPP